MSEKVDTLKNDIRGFKELVNGIQSGSRDTEANRSRHAVYVNEFNGLQSNVLDSWWQSCLLVMAKDFDRLISMVSKDEYTRAQDRIEEWLFDGKDHDYFVLKEAHKDLSETEKMISGDANDESDNNLPIIGGIFFIAFVIKVNALLDTAKAIFLFQLACVSLITFHQPDVEWYKILRNCAAYAILMRLIFVLGHFYTLVTQSSYFYYGAAHLVFFYATDILLTYMGMAFLCPNFQGLSSLFGKDGVDWWQIARVLLLLLVTDLFFGALIFTPILTLDHVSLAVLGLLVLAIQTLSEEILFRSILLHQEGFISKFIMGVITGCWFGYCHTGRELPLTLAGLSYALVVLCSGSINVTWAMHFWHNLSMLGPYMLLKFNHWGNRIYGRSVFGYMIPDLVYGTFIYLCELRFRPLFPVVSSCTPPSSDSLWLGSDQTACKAQRLFLDCVPKPVYDFFGWDLAYKDQPAHIV
mgnify:CR=1 FL=1